MNSPTITVLIIAFNYGQFIEDAINSVFAQDFPLQDIEIIVVDDGSTDDTRERVAKYGSRVQYCYKPNGGQASALNFGITRAKGEMITFLDADDLFLPKKLARVVEAFKTDTRLGMVYHRIEEWHMNTGERRGWNFAEVSGDLRQDPQKFAAYVTPPNLAISFRRQALKELLPIPDEIRMVADCYLASLIPLLSPVLAIPEVLAIYRIHGVNSHYKIGLRVPLEARRQKLLMWQTVITAMRAWLANNGYTRELPSVTAMLDRWTAQLQGLEFAASRPGRISFLFRLLKDNYAARPLQTWRFTILNYLTAFSVLFVDYKTAAGFYDWQLETQEAARRYLIRLCPFLTVSKQSKARVS